MNFYLFYCGYFMFVFCFTTAVLALKNDFHSLVCYSGLFSFCKYQGWMNAHFFLPKTLWCSYSCRKGIKKDCSVMIILFVELLSLCTYRYSNCINKTHAQAIRINFFCQVDIFQLVFPMLIHVGLPSVLISHLSHQRNITSDHDFRPCKALLVKAVFLI